MSRIIHLELTHPELPPGDVEGYRFLWARYVRGFDSGRHCQPCLIGPTGFWTRRRTSLAAGMGFAHIAQGLPSISASSSSIGVRPFQRRWKVSVTPG